MSDDPFRALGLGPDSTADEVRAARRRLAKRHHPDTGGDSGTMRAVNAAAADALRRLDHSTPSTPSESTTDGRSGPDVVDTTDTTDGTTSDVPSFTVEALPAETFEALLVVAAWIGEALDDDPPYRLDTHIHAPFDCWCRLDLLPDAGASTVNLTIAAVGGHPLPPVEAVRDLWVDQLNRYDW